MITSLSRHMRLAAYRAAAQRAQTQGRKVIGSEELSRTTRVNATQIRRDLSTVGHLGTKGVGYTIASFIEALDKLIDRPVVVAEAIGRIDVLEDVLHDNPGFRQTRWLVTGIEGVVNLTLSVLTTDRAVVERIEQSAETWGVVLTRLL